MTRAQFEAALKSLIRQPLRELGFEDERWLREDRSFMFRRPRVDGWDVIHFGGRIDGLSYRFTCTVGIEFSAIEEVMRLDPEAQNVTTILVPIHFLREDRASFEWAIEESGPACDLQAKVVKTLHELAVPFWARYTTLDNVKAVLESEDPKDWFVFNPERRLSVLAAISFCKGDSKGALSILEEGLEERRDAPPKRRRKLERLHGRLMALR